MVVTFPLSTIANINFWSNGRTYKRGRSGIFMMLFMRRTIFWSNL